ncbi:MAG: type II toxin-antitoxin system HicA family toxin [Christensenellaceae bacterium]|jgi:predicted RNA binding protein YcfA (HicA-like mRNA interferase family)|nr:type II toxin-antitoxin system HicA family toxin [Christensenellaceae bacterium]
MGNTYDAKELKKLALRNGFEIRNQKGSHLHFVHKDGRKVTIPMHGGDMKKGTAIAIYKIINGGK